MCFCAHRVINSVKTSQEFIIKQSLTFQHPICLKLDLCWAIVELEGKKVGIKRRMLKKRKEKKVMASAATGLVMGWCTSKGSLVKTVF